MKEDMSDGEKQLARALWWCTPCLEERHGDCEMPCGCTLHPHTGKWNPYVRLGPAHQFTDEQKAQIKAYVEGQSHEL
jgi:hypothetical protein